MVTAPRSSGVALHPPEAARVPVLLTARVQRPAHDEREDGREYLVLGERRGKASAA